MAVLTTISQQVMHVLPYLSIVLSLLALFFVARLLHYVDYVHNQVNTSFVRMHEIEMQLRMQDEGRQYRGIGGRVFEDEILTRGADPVKRKDTDGIDAFPSQPLRDNSRDQA